MSNFTKFGHTLKVNKLETKLNQNKKIRHLFSSGSDIKWSLEICQDDEGVILIYFDVSKLKSKSQVRAFSKFSLIAKDGHEAHTIETGLIGYEAGRDGWQRAILTREQLSNEKNNLLPGGILTIHTEIDFKVIPCKSQLDEFSLLTKIFDDRKFTDVKLVAGGVELRAHKAVLAARSPVFDRMFSNKSKKDNLRRVEIMDFEFDVIRDMLGFIYTYETPFEETLATEQTEIDEEQKYAIEVYKASEKYRIDDLKIVCEERICEYFSVQNIIQVLKFALNHNAAQIKDQAIRFICFNSKKVIERDEWTCLVKESPDLTMMVMRKMVSYMSGTVTRQLHQDSI